MRSPEEKVEKRDNRRRSRRAKARTNVKVQCRKGAHGFGKNLACSVLDISDTGARLIITEPLEVLGEVEILIDGYGMNASIKRLGNVRWQVKLESGEFCVGIEFQKCLDYRDWFSLALPT